MVCGDAARDPDKAQPQKKNTPRALEGARIAETIGECVNPIRMGARAGDLESPAGYGEAIPETTVEVAGLRYAVGEKVILENVSMVFEPGHLTALMGPSGAGKTTLMNVVSGRAGGTVATGGVYVNGARAAPAALRLLMSYMPQDDILYPALTVRQTLRYATLLRCPEHWKVGAKLARADDIAAKLGLGAASDTFPPGDGQTVVHLGLS